MARAEVRVSLKDVPEIKALIERLTERAETAEAAIERALAIWREHTNTRGPGPANCKCIACDMARALDGTETEHG